MNATNSNAQLALELLQRLAPIHGTSDVRERQRLVTVGGCAHLIPQIDWDGAALDYVAGLLGVLSADGKVTLVGYLAGLMGPVGLKLGPDDRPSLEALQARVAGLSTDEWAQAFTSGCFNDGRRVRAPVLHTLRAPTSDFTGRTDDIASLVAHLRQDGSGAPIIGIRGMGGIGKTELALFIAQAVTERYPDAQLVFELQPGDVPLTPEALLAAVIHTFQPEARLPDALAELQGLYRDALAGRRGLLLLDNAVAPDQVRPLLPPPAGWAVLVTSRARFPLPGARLHDVDLLPLGDALALLARLLSEGGRDDLVAVDHTALAETCGRLPLALRLAGGFLTTYADWSLADYLAALQAERLKHLVAPGEPSIPAMLAPSLTRLRQLDPVLAARWTQLAVFPAPFDRVAAAAIWGTLTEPPADDLRAWPAATPLPDVETRAALSALVQQSLLNYDPASTTYTLHDLLRECILADTPGAADLDRARLRHAWHYLRAGSAANALYLQGGAHVVEAVQAVRAIWPHLLAAWSAFKDEADTPALRYLNTFPAAIVYVLDLQVPPHERIVLCRDAAQAAHVLGDRCGEGNHLGHLGRAYADLGEVRRAFDFYEVALAILREICAASTPGSAEWTEGRNGEGVWLGNLGNAYYRLGEVCRAIACHEEGLAISREIGDRRGEGADLGHLGLAYAALGDMRRAIEFHEGALAISREIGDRRNEGAWLGNLGNAYYRLGDMRRAIEFYERALAINREIGDRPNEGTDLESLGSACNSLGDMRRAIEFYEGALAIRREIGDRRGEGADLGHLGLAYAALGEVQRAIEYYEAALAISWELGDRRSEGDHLGNLGLAYADLGEVRRAIACHEGALAISREICAVSAPGSPEWTEGRRGEGADLSNLGRAYATLGEVRRALEFYEVALAISREIGDHRNEGNWLGNLGTAYAALGEVRRAMESYEGALAISREIGDRAGEGNHLGNLGSAYATLGEVRRALEFYEVALAIGREIGDHRGEGAHLANMGGAYMRLGDAALAHDHWRQALTIFEAIESPHAATVRAWLAEADEPSIGS